MFCIRNSRRTLLLTAILILFVYALVIAGFEASLGIMQPQSGQGTMIISTVSGNGETNDRVVARLEDDNGQLYVAANHWPRAWYRQALDNPNVQIDLDGSPENYLAIPVSESEHERLNTLFPLGPGFRFLTGFPPRRFLILQPAD